MRQLNLSLEESLDLLKVIRKSSGASTEEDTESAEVLRRILNNASIYTPELKWKTYKAILTQSSTNAPIARVLNQDDEDFLGDIVWTRSGIGSYIGTFEIDLDNGETLLNRFSSTNLLSQQSVEVKIQRGTVRMTTGTVETNSDSILSSFPLELKVRQRGVNPILLEAVTSEDGKQVILTFNKEMSSKEVDISLTGLLFINSPLNPINHFTRTIDTIILSNSSNLPIVDYGSTHTCSYTGGDMSIIESLDYGILQSFSNFIVVNRVLAP